MAWKSRARSSAARIAPSKEPPHGPYGREGSHTQPSEERRHGSDTTQNRREATGREEAGEPSEDRASSGDPPCKECKEPAGGQAWNETAQARLTDRPLAGRRWSERWGGGRSSGRHGSRRAPGRTGVRVGARAPGRGVHGRRRAAGRDGGNARAGQRRRVRKCAWGGTVSRCAASRVGGDPRSARSASGRAKAASHPVRRGVSGKIDDGGSDDEG